MNVKVKKPARVNVVTLGCSKNTVDSEVLLAQLRSSGIEAVHERPQDRQDIVVINTCGFIESAKQQSIDTILQYAEAKEQGLVAKLYVTGCLSERYRDSLKSEIPEVDAWFGTRDLSRLLKQLSANYQRELIGERILTNPCHYAYLKISEGCNRPCSFCAIPIMRGRHVSKPMEDVVKEAKMLAQQGVKELLVIAQDTTFYGLDLYRRRALAELLQRLSDVEGLQWIRLHYAFPADFPADVIDVIAERDSICKYLDMPLQHASTAVLKAMKRGITEEKTRQLIARIRERVPRIALRTTMMVGHPGETDQDFEKLMEFISEIQFDRLGVFTYSHEEGTASYALPDTIPSTVKQQRMNALMALQQGISLEKNQRKIGQIIPVLIDRQEGEKFIGRTEADSPEIDNEVIISTPTSLPIGDFVNVVVKDAQAFDLLGVPSE